MPDGVTSIGDGAFFENIALGKFFFFFKFFEIIQWQRQVGHNLELF
jgi:hypothetical protein